MNERQRQDYLEAMGIQPWFPRVILPGAKPSVTCEWDYECDPVASPAEPPLQQAVATISPSPISPSPISPALPQDSQGSVTKTSRAILSELGYTQEQAPVAPIESPQASPEVLPETVETAEPFRLTAVDVSEHILAVIDLPWSGEITQFTNMHRRLLGNIIKALGLPSDNDWKQGVFAWPLLPESVPVHRRYAKEAVRAYLTNQFGLKRRKILLLFGKASTAWLWDETQSFDECHGMHERDDVCYGITYSLGELMNIPGLKAEAWASLKPLLHASLTSQTSTDL